MTAKPPGERGRDSASLDQRKPAGCHNHVNGMVWLVTDRRGVLLTVLLFTMTASSFQIFAIAVLAVDIIDDLEISRTTLGLIGSLNTLVGAVTAPSMGRVTDRIGAHRAIVAALAISGAGIALMALSFTWITLAASAVLSGIPQGWGNPATNALIAERVPAAEQGTVTGIKQSGVQFGIFLSGFTLPGLALVFSWRGALWGFAAIYTVGALVVARGLERSTPAEKAAASAEVASANSQPIPGFIWIISIYAFLFGTAGGAIGRFFPLWANEVVGLSTVVAGILVALGGLLGIAARIAAGRLAQKRIAPAKLLSILAAIGASYCLILAVTTTVGSWILWPATILYATGIGAWNAVAMLAVIVSVPRAAAGRASGIVMFGFLGGLTVGSPITGLVVDRWGTYQPVWFGALVLSVISSIIISERFTATRGMQQAPVATTP